MAHARAASPFYRSHRDWPAIELGTLQDVALLPFTEQADLGRNDSGASGVVAKRRRSRCDA
jgi:phenylacetate-coenzyme A ligase PaaK-like adenylate-forming protein